jgi:two-component sensor histidine kinase
MNNNFRYFMRDSLAEQLSVGDDIFSKMYAHRHQDYYQGQLDVFRRAFEGRPQQVEIPLIGAGGVVLWLQAFLNPVNIGEELEEVSCLMYDTTERKEIDKRVRDSLKEKEILLQEVHHRVKNNLQVISSILSLQSNYVTDERTKEILWESQQRIKSMSFVHETLYRTADFSSIDFHEYLRALASNLLHSYKPTGVDVDFRQSIDSISMPIDQAIPCGLIVNELISNSLKYAFTGKKKGSLELCVKDEGENICLRVTDDGVGLPQDFKYEESESLGIQLVYTLCEQLDAKLEIQTKKNGGTTFRITFGKL